MAAVMRAADLVLCRAGASTISELTALGVPALIVPSPYVTNNHQEKNARVLENAGGAAVLLEKDKRSDISTNANERCIDAICPNAEWMIVVADGNTDGRFDAIKEEYGIPLTIIDTTLDFTELAKQAFIKSE